LINLELEWLGHIVADEFEEGILKQVEDVAFAAGEEVVEADDLVPFVEQAFAKMGAKKSRPSGDQDAHAGNANQKRASGKLRDSGASLD
jgi:hypothetical protein